MRTLILAILIALVAATSFQAAIAGGPLDEPLTQSAEGGHSCASGLSAVEVRAIVDDCIRPLEAQIQNISIAGGSTTVVVNEQKIADAVEARLQGVEKSLRADLLDAIRKNGSGGNTQEVLQALAEVKRGQESLRGIEARLSSIESQVRQNGAYSQSAAQKAEEASRKAEAALKQSQSNSQKLDEVLKALTELRTDSAKSVEERKAISDAILALTADDGPLALAASERAEIKRKLESLTARDGALTEIKKDTGTIRQMVEQLPKIAAWLWVIIVIVVVGWILVNLDTHRICRQGLGGGTSGGGKKGKLLTNLPVKMPIKEGDSGTFILTKSDPGVVITKDSAWPTWMDLIGDVVMLDPVTGTPHGDVTVKVKATLGTETEVKDLTVSVTAP